MKNLNRITGTMIILTILCSLFVYASPAAIPAAGEYIMFGVENMGYLIDSNEAEMTSVLTLSEDGTGYMGMNDDGVKIVSWTQEGNNVSFNAEDGSNISCEILTEGIIKMTMYEGAYLYYASEGTDISAFNTMSRDEMLSEMAKAEAEKPEPDSKLYAFYKGLKPDEGIHMNYDVHIEKMDMDTRHDIHSKNGIYYGGQFMLDSEYREDVNATYYEDGNVYSLSPRIKTAILAATTNSDYIKENVTQLDPLFSAIAKRAPETEYTEVKRVSDGNEYLAEIYPADASFYNPEEVFLFDDEGNLVYYIVTLTDTMGEMTYKVNIIDDKVDESLLTISDYEIKQLEY